MRPAIRLLVPFAIAGCFGPDDRPQSAGSPEPAESLVPAGLVWSSGATGALIADSIRLFVFYRAASGQPIGLPRPSLSWSSSDTTKMRIVSDTLAVALDTGAVVLQARTRTGPTFDLDVPFTVVPPFEGRLVWIRQPARDSQFTELMIRDFPSGQARRVPSFGHPRQSKANPTVTFDRRTIAVTAPNNEWGTNHVTFLVDGDAGTHRLMFDTTGGRRFEELSPKWLRGDSLLAFVAVGVGAWEVFTARADGSNRRQRSSFRQSIPWFDAAPDGYLIVEIGGDLQDWPLAGGQRRILTNTDAHEGDPAVSPDGRLIAYGRYDEASGQNVWLMNRDGSGQRPLFSQLRTIECSPQNWCTRPSSSSGPTWTPDGKYVVLTWSVESYLRPQGDSYDHPGQLYAIRVADGLAIRLTRTTTVEVQAAMR